MKLIKELSRRQWLAFLASLAVIAVVFNSWFLNFGVRTAGDWSFLLDVTSDTLRRFYFSIWLSDNQFGRVLIDAGQAPTYAIYGWLSHYLGTSYALNERLIHLWPAVIFAVFGSYFLAKYIFKDRTTAALGSLVYAANTYYLALLTGHLTLAGAYAFAPLVILFYLKAIGSRDIVQILLCALTFAVSGAYEPRSATILAGILALLAVYHFLFIYMPRHKLTVASVLTTLSIYAAPFVLFGLMNLYWLLGLKYAGGAAAGGGVIESSLFGNEFFNISQTLTLMHPFWSGGIIQPFILHHIPVYFWLIPMVAIAGFALNRHNKAVLFFMILGILGILLSKQSDGPFPSLYYWLFTNVPGFNLFREASKFYVLITLSYAILIPALFWYVKSKYRNKYLTVAVFAGLSMLFLPNLIPVATNKIGATFAERAIPQQYVEVNELLNEDEYSRILWVPQKSRWGLASATHPTVSGSKLLSESWKGLEGGYAKQSNATNTDEIASMLSQNYMPVMLSNGGIKYVVVPMRDIANSDNFYRSYNDDPELFNSVLASSPYLKKADKQVAGFSIYEAKTPIKPYFSSTTNAYAVSSSDDLSSVYGLVKDTKDPVFVINDDTKATKQNAFTTDVTDLFAGYALRDLQKSELPKAAVDATKKTEYYFDSSFKQTSYAATNTAITFQQKILAQPVSGSSNGNPTSQTIPLSKSKTYVTQTGPVVNEVPRNNRAVNLGAPRADTNLYSIDSKSVLPKADKQSGLWQKDPEDCVPYGNKAADIAMSGQRDGSIDMPVIALSANNHAACTGPEEFAVEPGSYLWHFRYKGISAQFASYQLTFDTGQKITKDIPVGDANWHVYDTVVTVPDGATKAKLRLITRPSNQVKDTAMVYFAEPELSRLGKVAEIDSASGKLQKTDVQASSLANYKANEYDNKIPNGSFENGLWQKKVGDCNAFDKDADLKMSLNTREFSEGKQSLQLEARKHTACTDVKKISVEGGSTYVLQFDYQSPNASAAGFALTMDDKSSTFIEEKIPVKDSEWHTYRKVITVPSDVHTISLAVFAFSDEENKSQYMVNRYDNVVLQQVPDVKNRFYAMSRPATEMANPAKIDFKQVSNTKKTVTVSGATKPFLLLMSEQYNPNWKLTPSLADEGHIKVNGYQNAWFVQPEELCKANPAACTKNANGSYDIRMTVQFTAQKWFNIGLVISVLTALGCIAAATAITLLRRAEDHKSELTEDIHETRKR